MPTVLFIMHKSYEIIIELESLCIIPYRYVSYRIIVTHKLATKTM